MKVSGLLSQYLYQQKRLQLAGMGVFAIDKVLEVPDPGDKFFQEFIQQIRFEPDVSVQTEDSLIRFIQEKSGKIKPLAIADLQSFLDLGREFLNISKPFFIEGIGILQKNKEGNLEFVPGLASPDNSASEKISGKPDAHRSSFPGEIKQPMVSGNLLRKGLILAGMILGLGVILGGGYLLYTRKTSAPESLASSRQPSPVQLPADSSMTDQGSADSLISLPNTPSGPVNEPAGVSKAGQYKFVFETTYRKRAIPRYAQVHELSSRIRMETSDSLMFKIFVVLPCSPADTSWKKDSLKAWYWGTRPRKITIEQ